jgi:hypothetical protein
MIDMVCEGGQDTLNTRLSKKFEEAFDEARSEDGE